MSDSVLPGLEQSPLWHPYTAIPAPGPRAVIARAAGAYVFEASGRPVFDATSSWWCITHGHCHPRLTEALARQAQTLDQVLVSPHTHPTAQALCEKLLTHLGEPYRKVFLSDDGSTAVEAGMKMAMQYWQLRGKPERSRFLSVELGYHGDTLGTIAIGPISQFHRFFQQGREAAFQSLRPYCYRCPLGKQYPGCGIACLEPVREYLEREGDKVAALVVEPRVLGAAGMVVYPEEYLDGLVRAAREKGILVIYDEVFTGFGRTGPLFAFQSGQFRPDIVCLSKGLTAGMMPMGATVTTEAVFRPFVGGPERTFYHGHTFTANGLGCAVALESLRIFEEEPVIARNRELSACLAGEVARFAELPRVGDVRHLGLIWAVELVADKRTREPFTPANGPGWRIAAKLWEAGYWIRPLHGVIYVIPPYCATESDLRGLFQVLYSELSEERNFQATR